MANLSRVLARHERQATQQLASEEGGDEQSSQEGGREEGSGLRETRGDDNDIPLLDLEELNNTQSKRVEATLLMIIIILIIDFYVALLTLLPIFTGQYSFLKPS